MIGEHLSNMATAMAIGMMARPVCGQSGDSVGVSRFESPEEAVSKAELRDIVMGAIAQLPDNEAQLVRRHYIDGEPSIIRKLGKYYEYYGTDKCEKEWLDFQHFRVIVVQRTDERRKNLLKQLNKQFNHRTFWLVTEADYKENIGGAIFKTPKDYETAAYSFLSV